MAALSHRNSRRARRAMGDINMVPFIDVMLVLLTIFMVTAPLITTGTINLPSVSNTGEKNKEDVYTLSINAQGAYQLHSKLRGKLGGGNLPELIATIRQEQSSNEQVPVVIAADKSLSYETVITTLDQLRKAGVAQVGLKVQQGN